MYLKILETNALKYMNDLLNIKDLLAHFLSVPGLAWQSCLKKTEVKLEFLTKNNMLLMVEK